ncbi:MAG: hypothetical protein ACKVOH_04795 [Chlamydiales bacterium]
MYKLLIFLFVATAALMAFFLFPLREADLIAYADLVKSSNPTTEKTRNQLISFCQQFREGVSKKIWLHDRFCSIESDSSNLYFFSEKEQVEVVEELERVRCTMQEKLFFEKGEPKQLVRYIEANKGCYHYNTQLFIADNVHIWTYKLEGHTLPKTFEEYTPVMAGRARSIELSLKGSAFDLKAQQFRALVEAEY